MPAHEYSSAAANIDTLMVLPAIAGARGKNTGLVLQAGVEAYQNAEGY